MLTNLPRFRTASPTSTLPSRVNRVLIFVVRVVVPASRSSCFAFPSLHEDGAAPRFIDEETADVRQPVVRAQDCSIPLTQWTAVARLLSPNVLQLLMQILNAVSRVRRRRRKKSMRHMNSATSDSVTKRASHGTCFVLCQLLCL